MAVSAQFQQFALDQLSAVLPVRGRRMFSGVGFYADELFFAIAHDDALFFKVDATTRPEFQREGMKAFQPGGEAGYPMNGYFELPPRLYEDSDELARWMRAAIAVAARAASLRKPRRTAVPPRKSAASRKRPRTSRGPSRAR